MISRIYIYIYIRNRWYFEFIKERHVYINLHDLELNYSICWIRVYIYIYIGFGDVQSLILFDKIRNSTVLNMFLNIFIKEGGINGIIGLLEYSICWFHVYMYRVLCNPHEILYRLYLNLQLVNSWFNVILLNFIIFIKP